MSKLVTLFGAVDFSTVHAALRFDQIFLPLEFLAEGRTKPMAARTCITSPMPYSRRTTLSTLNRAPARSISEPSSSSYYGYRTSSYRDRYLSNLPRDGGTTLTNRYTPSSMCATKRPSLGTRHNYSTSNSSYGSTASTSTRYRSPIRGTSYDAGRYVTPSSTGRLGGGSTIISNRPLPTGPGPLDERGHKMDIDSINARSRASRSESVGRRQPVKATHLSSPRRNSPSSELNSKPSTHSLIKRTSSITNITADLDNINISSTSTTPVMRRGRTGSHDISASTRNTPDQDLYDTGSNKVTTCITKNYYNTGSHSYDYRDREENTDSLTSPVFPNIKKTGGMTTRSPSQDRFKDEDLRGTKRSVIANGTRGSDRLNTRDTSDLASGLVGLKNLGNTCFMNSILQCLSNTRLLREYCLSDEYTSDINRSTSSMKGALVSAYAKLIKSMWKNGADSHISPTEFKSQIAKYAPRFVGYNQQDAQEILIYLLEGLHEDVNRVTHKKKPVIMEDDDGEEKISASEKATQMWKRYLERDNSKIVDLFVGQLKSALKCTSCGYTSNTFDPYWDLSLPIKKRGGSEVTLMDCFELFTQEEVLDGDEKPRCARCKTRRKCTKSFSIQRFPKILIIHLKRFNPESFIRAKLSTLVDFPLRDLDLSKFAAEKSQAPVLYNLYAVSNHSGSTFSGHYTAYCKSSKSNDWNYFNDSRVSSITSNHIKSSEGYVLFYELSNSSHPSRL